jgi:hypothetical protein
LFWKRTGEKCGSNPTLGDLTHKKPNQKCQKKGTFDGTSWNLTSQNGIWSAKDFINHNSEFDNHELGTEVVTPKKTFGDVTISPTMSKWF